MAGLEPAAFAKLKGLVSDTLFVPIRQQRANHLRYMT